MSTANRELVFERILSAPRELVFDVWTDPLHLARWYGPDGFTITTYFMDARTGGTWLYTLHGPDGRDYPNKVTFTEFERPERLVYKHMNEIDCEPVSHEVAVTFLEAGPHTKVTLRMTFQSAADLQRVAREYGAIEGAHQTLSKLENHLLSLREPRLAPLDNQILSTRLFDFAPAHVFRAWTDPSLLALWWGPKGFTNTFEEFNLRPGGDWRFIMHDPDGNNYPNECIFIAIAEPLQLIWRHVSAPEFYVITNFEADAGRTRVVFKMIFNTAEECQRVRKYAVAVNEQNFDRLENVLVIPVEA